MGESLRCTVLGDIAITGALADQAKGGKGEDLLRGIHPYLSRSDIVIANLETVVSDSLETIDRRGIKLRSPAESIELLKSAGVEVVGLANNHVMDCGPAGLRETIERLDAAGVQHFGAGSTIEEAREPLLIEKSGLRLALVGRSGRRRWYTATKSRSGVAPFSIRECQEIIRELMRQDVRLIMLHLHFGEELYRTPWPSRIKKLEHLAKTTDSSVIIGGHQHVYQGLQRLDGKLVLTSSGNFLMDVSTYFQDDILARCGCATTLSLDQRGCWSVDQFPFEISHNGIVPASESAASRLFAYTDYVEELVKNKPKLKREWENECYQRVYGDSISLTRKVESFVRRADKNRALKGWLYSRWLKIRSPLHRDVFWSSRKVHFKRRLRSLLGQ